MCSGSPTCGCNYPGPRIHKSNIGEIWEYPVGVWNGQEMIWHFQSDKTGVQIDAFPLPSILETEKAQEMKLYNVLPDFGYGGGFSMLVRARSKEDALRVARRVVYDGLYKEARDIGHTWEIDDLQEGEYVVLGYYE